MKESIIFLKEKLSELYSEHSHLEIRYEYKSIINTHVIEVKPVHCFNSDRPYILKQIEVEDAFENTFFGEDIVFITDDSLIKINNPILSLGVSTINVDLSEFEQLKVSFVVGQSSLTYDEYIIPQDFDVFIAPPDTKNDTSNIKDSGVKLESFLF
ncbi:hypothetical protein Flavo103_08610 [Flavobacterium collinsii]|uniref:hypothetical protein n=1 Tax=Flavobacterium collinsii TaxID=1114861 RepID=UPI0022BB94A6|nr:hypothetical protein [Flavobacterium collinsii]GIQ57725.1 hypothetical protein Flavo103_08610 [Flavobacterium collinsii]